jgi:hypothetical protein
MMGAHGSMSAKWNAECRTYVAIARFRAGDRGVGLPPGPPGIGLGGRQTTHRRLLGLEVHSSPSCVPVSGGSSRVAG